MNRPTMLTILSDEGTAAGSDYNDAETVHGRFAWSIEQDGHGGGILSVTYEDLEAALEPITLRWALTPLGLRAMPEGP